MRLMSDCNRYVPFCLITLMCKTVVLHSVQSSATFLAMQCSEVQHAMSASVHLLHLNGSIYQNMLCTK